MGSMLIIGTIMALIALLIVCLAWKLKAKQKCSCCKKVIDKLKEKLFWNAFIRYTLQSYLKLAFANFVALATLKWGEF